LSLGPCTPLPAILTTVSHARAHHIVSASEENGTAAMVRAAKGKSLLRGSNTRPSAVSVARRLRETGASIFWSLQRAGVNCPCWALPWRSRLSARWLEWLHPMRVSRYAFATDFNPWLRIVVHMPDRSRLGLFRQPWCGSAERRSRREHAKHPFGHFLLRAKREPIAGSAKVTFERRHLQDHHRMMPSVAKRQKNRVHPLWWKLRATVKPPNHHGHEGPTTNWTTTSPSADFLSTVAASLCRTRSGSIWRMVPSAMAPPRPPTNAL